MSLQVARGQPRTKDPLHTNAITRALVLLDQKDVMRIRRQTADLETEKKSKKLQKRQLQKLRIP